MSTLQNWAPEQRGDLSARWEWHHGLLAQTQHTGQRPEAPKGSRSWVVLKLQKETILGYRISQPPSHNRGRDQKAAKPSWGMGAAHLSYLHLGATSFFFLPFFYRVPWRGTPRVLAPLHLSPFSPPDRDRRVDSPAFSGRGSRPSWCTSG